MVQNLQVLPSEIILPIAIICKAGPDVYYGYMLLYVDDALCIHHNAKAELLKLDKHSKMRFDRGPWYLSWWKDIKFYDGVS